METRGFSFAGMGWRESAGNCPHCMSRAIIKSMVEAKNYKGIPESIDGITLDEIYELFAKSHYGEKLRQAIRYAPFKPENISNEKWVEILGTDVSNLEHLKFTLSLTQDFLRFSANPHKEWMSRERES